MNELKQLGRYQLLRVLGRGAMGLVYEGVDPKLNRRVAIKVIQMSRIDDPALRAEYAARFITEAQAVARLNHPNIVTVYDFGEESGVAYLVMELIAGEELGSYFDDSQMFSLDFTLEDSVRMTCELLDALDYAHQHGIIHRDIKPANVMLTAQLRVKLTDFGVARMQDVEANHTQAGTMVGTPSYMSPEQIMGQPVGPRADIFAAGIILYQFLTGERPFKGQGLFALQQQIVYGQVAPPSTLSPLPGSALDRVVLRALAKRPEDRYASARAFRDDLQRALAGDADHGDTLPPGRAAPPAVPAAAPGATAAIIQTGAYPAMHPAAYPAIHPGHHAAPGGPHPGTSPGMPAWQAPPPGPWQGQTGHNQALPSGAHWPAQPAVQAPPGAPWQHAQSGAAWPAPPYPASPAAPAQQAAQQPVQPAQPGHPGGAPSGLVMPSQPRPAWATLPDDTDPDATNISGTGLPPLPPDSAPPAAPADGDATVAGTTPPRGNRS